jgi:chemotaxis protein histidine kinase CheA
VGRDERQVPLHAERTHGRRARGFVQPRRQDAADRQRGREAQERAAEAEALAAAKARAARVAAAAGVEGARAAEAEMRAEAERKRLAAEKAAADAARERDAAAAVQMAEAERAAANARSKLRGEEAAALQREAEEAKRQAAAAGAMLAAKQGELDAMAARVQSLSAAHSGSKRLAPQGGASAVPLLRPYGAKVALCVGCSAYAKPHALPNACNDARAMAAKLRTLGFAADMLLDPPDVDAFDAAISRFVRNLEPGGCALFFFAGHGVAAPDGSNYMLPCGLSEAQARDPAALRRGAFSVQDVLERLKKADSLLNVLIADACRIAPAVPRAMGRGMVVTGGFERLSGMPAGSVIAFACEAGKEALDGASVDAVNGVFTTALLAQLDKERPVHVDTMFIRVTKAVEDATDSVQTPWHNHILREENICFF